MKKFFFLTFLLTTILLPVFTLAQTTGIPNTPTNFKEMTCIFVKLVLDFIPYVVVIAVGAFLMGLIKYVGHGDNEEKRTEGNKLMIYGIVGFFIMVSIWGILQLFVQSFGFTNFGVPQFAGNGDGFTQSCR